MKIVDNVDDIVWDTIPGRVPNGQILAEEVGFDADIEIREGD